MYIVRGDFRFAERDFGNWIPYGRAESCFSSNVLCMPLGLFNIDLADTGIYLWLKMSVRVMMHCALTLSHILEILSVNVLLCSFPKYKYTKLNIFIVICCMKLPV